MTSEPELVAPRDRAAWRKWLQRHHTQDAAIWLELRRKGAAGSGIVYPEAVEEALCFGWIDSRAKRLDEERYAMWFARRKPRSAWSAVNKARVERLIAEGRMTDPGLVAIEVARGNGAWDALNDSDAFVVPEDLAAALAQHGEARRHWDAFPPSVRKQNLEWINAAKRRETRAKRVSETAALAADDIRAHQWRPKP